MISGFTRPIRWPDPLLHDIKLRRRLVTEFAIWIGRGAQACSPAFESERKSSPLMMMFIVRIRCSRMSSHARAFCLPSVALEIGLCSSSTSRLEDRTGTERRR